MSQKYVVVNGEKINFTSTDIDAYLTEYNYGYRVFFYDDEDWVVYERYFRTKDDAEDFLDTVLAYGV